MGCHFFLQRILPTQELNPCLLHCRRILYHWATREAHMRVCVCVCVCVCVFFSTQMIVSTLRYWKALQTKKIFHSVNHLTLQVADDGGLNLDPLRALILVSDPALVSNGTCGSSTEDSCPATGPNVSTNRAERALQFYFSQGSPGSVICMWP